VTDASPASPAGALPAGGRPAGAQSIEEVLAAARSRLTRLPARDAYRELSAGAVVADIRPAAMRAASGEIPGSWIVERNHLEWRFDPASDARLPFVADYGFRVIVICAEGYTSSLAAAALLDLGLSRATDVIGGYAAWTAAGLPAAPASAGSAFLAPGASAAAS
jgi:rhodanese-related sulfurtransferase